MANKILITGTTGNVGCEVIHYLFEQQTQHVIVAGVRNIEKANVQFSNYPKLQYVPFNFEDPTSFSNAFAGVDILFLLRPPHIADIETYFKPLLMAAKDMNIKKIMFLSVQGAERSKVIPHHKIEALIKEYNFDYLFLRPSYFMQNLTTTLAHDIKNKRKIILPAGNAVFNWIDIKNIGELAAKMLNQIDNFLNQAIEITGGENESFSTIVDLINNEIPDKISYDNANPFRFYQIKKKDGMSKGMIMVMIMLHFLPRFQKAPNISDVYEKICGKKPTLLKEFVHREKVKFLK